jgi:ribosomal protein S7
MIKLFEFNCYSILCNKLQNKGLKNFAYRRLIFLFESLKFKFKYNNIVIFKYIFLILQIYVYIYKKKIGANIHQIPIYVRKNLRLKKGLSNFLHVIKLKKEKNFKNKLFKEFVDIVKLKGSTITFRDNIYKTATEEKSNIRFIRKRKRRIPLNLKRILSFRFLKKGNLKSRTK